MAATTPFRTYVPLPANPASGNDKRGEDILYEVPIHIITDPSQLPPEILCPSPDKEQVIGFDCEGVDLSRDGILCIMQIASQDAVYIIDAFKGGDKLMQACKPVLESDVVTKVIHDCKRDSEALYFQFGIKLHNVMDTQIAYNLFEEQEGRPRSEIEYISFVDLLADHRYCGISYAEKKKVRGLLKEDPMFWTYRPFTEEMVTAAADDVRFLPYIYHKIMEKLNQKSLWQLAVRGNNKGYNDWPAVPAPPDGLVIDGKSMATCYNVDNQRDETNDDSAEFTVKTILFLGQSRRILLQNKNGPCSLIAICNVLLLRGTMILETDRVIKQDELMQLLSTVIQESNVQDSEVTFWKLFDEVCKDISCLQVMADCSERLLFSMKDLLNQGTQLKKRNYDKR